jgi:hypothetical protein
MYIMMGSLAVLFLTFAVFMFLNMNYLYERIDTVTNKIPVDP